jgi:hypothetical protein
MQVLADAGYWKNEAIEAIVAQDPGLLGHTGGFGFLNGGLDHRLQVRGVERLDRDLRRDHDLSGGNGGLGVVALDPTARGLEVARVGGRSR